MKWFYIDESIVDGERRQGPYTIDEIRDFVNQGKINDETLVWHTGDSDWKTWKEAAQALENDPSTLNSDQDKLLESTIKTLEAIIEENKRRTRLFAGFFPRAAALLIDNAIISLILLFGLTIYFIVSIITGFDPTQLLQAANDISNPDSQKSAEAITVLIKTVETPTFLAIALTIQTIYFVVFHAIHSATPGKRLLHIHVETVDGNRLTWGSAIVRYICSLFTQFTLALYGLGYLIVLVDPKRRALHDWIARTMVVHDDKEIR